MTEQEHVREALLWAPEGPSARCGLCERRCLISPGKFGHCKTRCNYGGKVLTYSYGNLSALESRPIEIKPFYHYWPGSRALTFSTWSCNMACRWCQNHHLSRARPDGRRSAFIPPESLLRLALDEGDRGLCASFQEPTLLFEYCMDLFPMAGRRGLYCCFVSNGYMTREALERLARAGLDGIKIDIKGGPDVYREYCGGADSSVPWKRAEEARKLGLHVEIVNLLVTDINDGEEQVSRTVEEHLKRLGPDVPLHFSRYHPALDFDRPATPRIRLERAREKAFRTGVRFPYVGNLAGHRYENTWCPRCNGLLVLRDGPRVLEFRITSGNRCPGCGESIPLTGTGGPSE